MEHIDTLRTLDPHTVTNGIIYCLVALVVAGAAVWAALRSWG
jgi:hypothetical protein